MEAVKVSATVTHSHTQARSMVIVMLYKDCVAGDAIQCHRPPAVPGRRSHRYSSYSLVELVEVKTVMDGDDIDAIRFASKARPRWTGCSRQHSPATEIVGYVDLSSRHLQRKSHHTRLPSRSFEYRRIVCQGRGLNADEYGRVEPYPKTLLVVYDRPICVS